MFDVAPAFQTTRRKMARSRKPTPLHSRSRTVWQMSLTSAFVHGRVLKKFPIFSFPFASDDFGFHTRWMISRTPRAQKKCVKLLSWFLLGALARFGDSLPLEIVCHCITQAIEKEAKLTIAAFMIEVHSFKEPLAVSLFRSRLLIAQW